MNQSLNTPFGARCFLTEVRETSPAWRVTSGLNTPFGARCFLTKDKLTYQSADWCVLMHLLALGAF